MSASAQKNRSRGGIAQPTLREKIPEQLPYWIDGAPFGLLMSGGPGGLPPGNATTGERGKSHGGLSPSFRTWNGQQGGGLVSISQAAQMVRVLRGVTLTVASDIPRGSRWSSVV